MNKMLVSALAVALVGSASFAAAPLTSFREPKVPFKLGIAGFTYHKQTLDATLAAMNRMGVRYLCVKDFHLSYSATDEQIAAFKEKCASYGVIPYALGPLYTGNAARLRPYFEFAKRMGVKTVVGVPYEPTDEKDTWSKRKGSRRLLEEIDRLVKEYDIRYAIHNHGPASPQLYPDVEYGWNLVKDLDKRIGFCLDVGWEYGCGKDPAETIRKYADRIFDVHIKNFDVHKPNGASVPLPRGKIDYVSVFRAFDEVGYSGVCSIEYEADFTDNLAPISECVGYFWGVTDSLRTPAKTPVP